MTLKMPGVANGVTVGGTPAAVVGVAVGVARGVGVVDGRGVGVVVGVAVAVAPGASVCVGAAVGIGEAVGTGEAAAVGVGVRTTTFGMAVGAGATVGPCGDQKYSQMPAISNSAAKPRTAAIKTFCPFSLTFPPYCEVLLSCFSSLSPNFIAKQG